MTNIPSWDTSLGILINIVQAPLEIESTHKLDDMHLRLIELGEFHDIMYVQT